MLGKRTLSYVFLVFSVVTLVGIIGTQGTHAQDLSVGCDTVKSGSVALDRLFLAGETVSLTITIPSGTTRGDIFFNGLLVATTGDFTGPDTKTASYTFQRDRTGDLAWTILSLGVPAGTLDVNTNCAYTGLPGLTVDVQQPPDDRINWRAGDDLAILYSRPDDFGNPALDVYCFLNGEGLWRFRLTEADLEAWDDSLPQEVPLATVPECNASLYELDNGQIQINIEVDAAKYYEIICEDLSCTARTIRFSDPSLWR